MPLQVPIDLYNAEQEYLQDAVIFIVEIYNLDSECSHFLFPYHTATFNLISSLRDLGTNTINLIRRLSVALGSPDNVRDPAQFFHETYTAIINCANTLLVNRDALISALHAKYGSQSILYYIPWLDISRRMHKFEALPTKIQGLLARLDRIQECAESFETHIHRMTAQISDVDVGSRLIVAERLGLLAKMLKWVDKPMSMRMALLGTPETIFTSPLLNTSYSQWVTPVLLRYEDHIIKNDFLRIRD